MKRKKLIRMLVLLITVLSLPLSACASKMSDYDTGSSGYDAKYGNSGHSSNNTTSDSSTQKDSKDDAVSKEEFPGFISGNTDRNDSEQTQDISSQDKIIRTFYLNIETMEFDKLITRINSEISRLGGYVESSDISGRSYYDSGARYGSITARIPSDRADEFIDIVGGNANVINSQESSKNVSLDYIDTESRIKTLKIEQERLYAILEKEIDLKNIITLESRLSDIQYELQSYESKLRYYDNQVAYSTVTMNIQEVEKLTPAVEIKQSVGTRIKNGFSNTVYNITEGCKNFFVWFVVNLPYLIIWGAIIAVIILIIRRIIGKDRKNKLIIPDEKNNAGDNSEDNDLQ